MTDLEFFYQLKKSVLEQYQHSYPYFNGSWKSFSSQDILNLIDDIHLKTKQTVSEKWMYTHLKPETNQKLPRKDMLDILSVYVGKSGWDEYVFKSNINDNGNININGNENGNININGNENDNENSNVTNNFNNNKNVKFGFSKKFGIWVLLFGILIVGFFIWKLASKREQKLEFQNSFTKDSIAKEEVKAYVVEDTIEKQIDIQSPNLNLNKETKIVIKSPLYMPKEIVIVPNEPVARVELNPNDYAMMLKAFMKSDIKDWQTRKVQLQKILSDNLEVMLMLPNNLGAEYFNKQEFSQKVILPSASLKKLKIIELKQENNNKISFLRLTTE